MLQSRSLIHHITRLDLMRPRLVREDYLKTLKFNMTNGFSMSSLNGNAYSNEGNKRDTSNAYLFIKLLKTKEVKKKPIR